MCQVNEFPIQKCEPVSTEDVFEDDTVGLGRNLIPVQGEVDHSEKPGVEQPRIITFVGGIDDDLPFVSA